MDANTQVAFLLIRTFVGVLFLFQGYDKVFRVKIEGVVNTFLDEAEHHHIRRPILVLIAAITSYTEFVGGILLIGGLFTSYTLWFLAADLVLAATAFSLLQPMWDLKHVFPRLVMVASMLLMPQSWNYFSLDTILNKL